MGRITCGALPGMRRLPTDYNYQVSTYKANRILANRILAWSVKCQDPSGIQAVYLKIKKIKVNSYETVTIKLRRKFIRSWGICHLLSKLRSICPRNSDRIKPYACNLAVYDMPPRSTYEILLLPNLPK